ncbi:head-tail connector protein [Clostridium oryzae]|uniref:Phage gp6-like head-tail connector protein n=1 Tax=Clostridium oryzae TaxID=1450648 RepID=A0A1V4IFK7_9CLOT|nr:head-tail connector protein [Clostridium oryzae]OPJ58445.1 hypothetical protein CLORY_35950 [Clostridium oryzae]
MLIDKVKLSLKIDDSTMDEDIQDSIAAAKADLELSGVAKSNIVETDPLIIRAVKTFCKAEYSISNEEANRYRDWYNSLKTSLAASTKYNTEGTKS